MFLALLAGVLCPGPDVSLRAFEHRGAAPALDLEPVPQYEASQAIRPEFDRSTAAPSLGAIDSGDDGPARGQPPDENRAEPASMKPVAGAVPRSAASFDGRIL